MAKMVEEEKEQKEQKDRGSTWRMVRWTSNLKLTLLKEDGVGVVPVNVILIVRRIISLVTTVNIVVTIIVIIIW